MIKLCCKRMPIYVNCHVESVHILLAIDWIYNTEADIIFFQIKNLLLERKGGDCGETAEIE